MTICGRGEHRRISCNLSNDEFVNVVYENKAETTEERDQRDLNLIVHGVKEDDAGSNTDRLVMEPF